MVVDVPEPEPERRACQARCSWAATTRMSTSGRPRAGASERAGCFAPNRVGRVEGGKCVSWKLGVGQGRHVRQQSKEDIVRRIRIRILNVCAWALCVLLLPAWAYAQAEIAGVVETRPGRSCRV